MRHYVVGFLFNKNLFQVALIEKQRPAWQFERLNGIGGGIEPGETALEAMRREFKEETGADIQNWEQFATLVCDAEKHPGAPSQGEPYHIYFFRATTEHDLNSILRTTSDEKVVVYDYDIDLHTSQKVLPNIHWLVPMALHIDADAADLFQITEVYHN